MMKNQKSKLYLTIMVLIVFMIQGATNIVSPRIAAFAEKWADQPYSTVLLLATIPTLMCIVSSIVGGMLQKRLGLKNSLICAAALFVGGGLLPLLSPNNLKYILATRVVFGLGYGWLYTLCANLVIGLFEEKEHQRIMGLGGIFNTVGVMFFSMGGAMLASGNLDNVWWICIVEAIPLIMALFIIDPSKIKSDALTEKVAETEPKTGFRMPFATWVLIFMFGFVGFFFNPIFIFSSTVIVDNQLGSSTDAAFLMTALAISGMVFSAVYSALGKKLNPKVSMVIGLLVFALGNFVVSGVQNIVMMYVGAMLIEWGFVWFYPSMTVIINKCTPAHQVPTANGIAVAVHNLFAFFTGNVLIWIMGIFGKATDMKFAFFLSGIGFVIMAVVGLMLKPKYLAEKK